MLRMRFTSVPKPSGRETCLQQISGNALAAVLLLLLIPATAGSAPPICGYPASGRVAISRAQQTLAEFTVTNAKTSEQRRRGLMNCPRLEPGTGMLFIYDDDRPRTFWMKDTPLDLAIIFIGADGRIMSIGRGIPDSRERIRSSGPVRYVLEINYQEARTLQAGDLMRRIAPDSARIKPGKEGQP